MLKLRPPYLPQSLKLNIKTRMDVSLLAKTQNEVIYPKTRDGNVEPFYLKVSQLALSKLLAIQYLNLYTNYPI
jgi:hypothetical protein